jgi:simple sugar transport system permease protein
VGIALAIPILWAALGEVIAELAGVINIGIEGVMLISALATAMVVHAVDSFVVALLAGIASGVACGLVLSWWYVFRGMNQIITGIVFNIFALGFTTAMYSYAEYLSAELGTTLPDANIPLLSSIPWVGDVLFQQDVLAYGAVVAAVVVAWLLRRTWFGLYVRAAGERPSAVLSTGRDVLWVRVVAVTIACALAGIGGAALVLSTSGGFNVNITAGQGFIALAVVVVARWNPFATVAACIVFGIAQGMQFQIDNLGVLGDVPVEVYIALPYIVTILALAFARGSRYPPACGVPFTRMGRSWIGQVLDRMRARRTVDPVLTQETP